MSVEEWFNWRDTKKNSVEFVNRERIKNLEWNRVDVLYSFLGIYTLGVYVKYKEKFICPSSEIRVKNTTQKLYSYNYLKNNYCKFSLVNKLSGIQELIEQYNSIGNVTPIWPGGNVDKGHSGCYDIPELYFCKYDEWFKALNNLYGNASLKMIMVSEYPNTADSFIDWITSDDNYEKYLVHVNYVISERRKELERAK